jgi:hypothetical protein
MSELPSGSSSREIHRDTKTLFDIRNPPLVDTEFKVLFGNCDYSNGIAVLKASEIWKC